MRIWTRAVIACLLIATLSMQSGGAEGVDPKKVGLLQSVQLLEMKLFGRTFFGGPILKRIDRLEDVVGLPHRYSIGTLARVEEIQKQIPKNSVEKRKAAARAVQAENMQISDKLWQNLTVPGVGVSILDAAVSPKPPNVVPEEYDEWYHELLAIIQRSASAALASTLAHTFGSVAVGAQIDIDCVLTSTGIEVSSIHSPLSDALNESVKKGIEALKGEALPAIPGKVNGPIKVSLRMQTMKVETEQSDGMQQ